MAACPMTVANQYGWEICAPTGFTVVWNGGANRRCLAIVPDDEHEGSRIISHFGGGIFTYSFPAIFKTEPGYDLWVQGPANYPVGGATAMSGIQESDWLLTQSAIHWKMAEPNRAIRFSKGDPLAQVFPIRRGELEAVEPELRSIEDEPEVKAYMEEWMAPAGRVQQGTQAAGFRCRAQALAGKLPARSGCLRRSDRSGGSPRENAGQTLQGSARRGGIAANGRIIPGRRACPNRPR